MDKTKPPPRQLSTDERSLHYVDWAIGNVEVVFNGKTRPNDVVSYDADDGWIEAQVRLPNGRLRIERGRVLTVRLRGVVEPRWTER